MSWVLALIAAAACGPDHPNGPSGDTMLVRLVNATSSTGDLELVVDGAVALSDIGAGEVSSFARVSADAPELAIQRKFGSFSLPLALPAAPLADGVFAVTVMGDNNLLHAAISEADTGRAVPGRANFRAISLGGEQASPDVDIHVTAPGAPLAGATPAWRMPTALALYSGLKDFAPGPLQVTVTLAGTTTVVAQSAVLTVGADQIRVITLRHAGGSSLELAVAVEAGQ